MWEKKCSILRRKISPKQLLFIVLYRKLIKLILDNNNKIIKVLRTSLKINGR